jgi:type IV secretion system protein TrbL
MRHTVIYSIIIFALAAASLCSFVGMANAQANGAQVKVDQYKLPDSITDHFEKGMKAWEKQLSEIATQLFWMLVLIELAWGAGRLIVRGADMSEWLSDFTGQLLFISFFWTLLQYSSRWADAIIRSFQTAAERAAQVSQVQAGFRPSDVFNAGWSAACKILNLITWWKLSDGLYLAIGAFIVMVCFAMMAAFMIVVLVESYFVISAGVLFMGFGGSRWTKHYALNVLSYAVNVGAKLFVIQLIAALAQQVFTSLALDYTKSNILEATSWTFLMVGAAMVFFYMMWTIPTLVAGLVSGQSLSSPHDMVSAANALLNASSNLYKAAGVLVRSPGMAYRTGASALRGGKTVAAVMKGASQRVRNKGGGAAPGGGVKPRPGSKLGGSFKKPNVIRGGGTP